VSGREPLPAAPAAILLDRDGVLVEPVPDPLTGTHESPLHAQDVSLVEGAADGAALLLAEALPVYVVSNQPAAAKGTVAISELRAVHERTVELLAEAGVSLSGWEYCFHHPDGLVSELSGPCQCRKPEPGLLTRVLDAGEFDPSRCWMAGDADTDVIAGCRAGTLTALLEHPLTAHRRRTGTIEAAGCEGPDLRAPGLLEFARRLYPTSAAA
jgi:D-glycero-D-manno-heptose 1,7-bisphosphate phosphatase